MHFLPGLCIVLSSHLSFLIAHPPIVLALLMQLFNSKQSALFLFFCTVFCTFFFSASSWLAQIVAACLYQNAFGLCLFFLFFVFFCLGEIEEGGGSLVVSALLYLNCEPDSVDVCLFVIRVDDLISAPSIMPVPFALEQQVAIAAVRRACALTTTIFNKLVAGETLVKGDNSPVTGAP
jgi:hypothetical protein